MNFHDQLKVFKILAFYRAGWYKCCPALRMHAFFIKDETHVTVAVKTNERAMEPFVKNFAPDVEVLQPESLRQKVKEELERAVEVYRKMEE